MYKSVNNFLSYTSTGLYCAAGDFYIDPKRAVHKALVSHAHSDHAVPNSGNIYCTKATKMIMNRRYKNSNRSHFHEIIFGEAFMMNEVKIIFYPAGHILGSAMILMEYNGEKYLYTGDFKLQSDESCEQIEYVKADYLITETTFAHPDYSHSNPEEEIKKLNDIQEQILIGAYSVGKAQRMTKLISSHCPQKKILVHNDITKFHEVYHTAGFDLGRWEPYRRQEFKDEQNCVYIIPPNYFSHFRKNKNIYKVFATGWKRKYFGCDALLNISDHADWNDLLKMIEMTEPKVVFTLHGDGTHLKEYLDGQREVHVLN